MACALRRERDHKGPDVGTHLSVSASDELAPEDSHHMADILNVPEPETLPKVSDPAPNSPRSRLQAMIFNTTDKFKPEDVQKDPTATDEEDKISLNLY